MFSVFYQRDLTKASFITCGSCKEFVKFCSTADRHCYLASCKHAACSNELFSLSSRLCFGGKRFWTPWSERTHCMEKGQSVFFLSPHTPYGRVRLARFARVRLLRHVLPISLLILRKSPTVLQSSSVPTWKCPPPWSQMDMVITYFYCHIIKEQGSQVTEMF